KPSKKEKGDFNNHKTVKPLELMEHLISLYAMNKNAIILDPFAGSGTTLLAAHNLGLNYIGIELNKDYVKIIKKRLKKRRKEFIPTDSVSKQQTFMSLK
ncbi:MAG: DNA methyltransferase, partial [Candidatus Zixiibacteriota bacterium]